MRFITYAALALLLLVPEVASAQRGGLRGGGWSGGGSGWSNSGFWNGGSWNGGRYWGGYYGNRGYYPRESFGWYGYSSPYFYYESPSIFSYDSTPRVSSYYDPMSDSTAAVRSSQAQVIIQVPDPNAELLIQGQRMALTGSQRVFVSPDLEPGKKHTYTISLKRITAGRNEDDTRQVDVQAGTISRVDFTRPATQDMPSPQQK